MLAGSAWFEIGITMAAALRHMQASSQRRRVSATGSCRPALARCSAALNSPAHQNPAPLSSMLPSGARAGINASCAFSMQTPAKPCNCRWRAWCAPRWSRRSTSSCAWRTPTTGPTPPPAASSCRQECLVLSLPVVCGAALLKLGDHTQQHVASRTLHSGDGIVLLQSLKSVSLCTADGPEPATHGGGEHQAGHAHPAVCPGPGRGAVPAPARPPAGALHAGRLPLLHVSALFVAVVLCITVCAHTEARCCRERPAARMHSSRRSSRRVFTAALPEHCLPPGCLELCVAAQYAPRSCGAGVIANLPYTAAAAARCRQGGWAAPRTRCSNPTSASGRRCAPRRTPTWRCWRCAAGSATTCWRQMELGSFQLAHPPKVLCKLVCAASGG